MNELPMAGTTMPGDDKQRLAARARAKFDASLANDTQWNELLTHMRKRDGWRPSFRYKWISGHVSGWDVEWYYHLPFPFVGVEWLDITLHEYGGLDRMLATTIIDHTEEIAVLLDRIGFAYEVRGDVARIWGYSPMSDEDFPPSSPGKERL